MTLRRDVYGIPYHKCSICGVSTTEWERINGGKYHCWKCGRKMREELYSKEEFYKKNG